jgi:hypothetical protein
MNTAHEYGLSDLLGKLLRNFVKEKLELLMEEESSQLSPC